MTVKEIARILEAEIITGEDALDTEIEAAFGADMMSDVLAFLKGNSLLLTGLVNQQAVRTAEMMDVLCIAYVRGKRPDDDAVALARSNNTILIATKFNMFHSCGALFEAGLPSCDMLER